MTKTKFNFLDFPVLSINYKKHMMVYFLQIYLFTRRIYEKGKKCNSDA
jgi:hypothetical protein